MKIRSKLLILILSMLASMVISLAVYIGFQIVKDISEEEKSELLLLKDMVQKEHIELSKFLYDGSVVLYQLKSLKEAIAAKNKTLDRVNNITLLPRMSDKIKIALNRIVLLDDLQTKNQNGLIGSIDSLLVTVEDVYGINSSYSLGDINSEFAGSREKYAQLLPKIP